VLSDTALITGMQITWFISSKFTATWQPAVDTEECVKTHEILYVSAVKSYKDNSQKTTQKTLTTTQRNVTHKLKQTKRNCNI